MSGRPHLTFLTAIQALSKAIRSNHLRDMVYKFVFVYLDEPIPGKAANNLLQSCMLGAIQWEIEERVKEANEGQSIPDACPTHFLSLNSSSPQLSSGVTPPLSVVTPE